MFSSIVFRLTGVAPLLMHNIQLANPTNQWARSMKEITGKRGKTDDDYERIAEFEWMGGVYVDSMARPCIPGEIIESGLVAAAKKFKMGQRFLGGVMSDGNWTLEYDGPKNAEKLWLDYPQFKDVRAVRVGNARVMRTRPIFRDWAATVEVKYDPENVNRDSVVRAMQTLGTLGIMDFRPKFGRFQAEVLDGRE